jgi:hypothetical protein
MALSAKPLSAVRESVPVAQAARGELVQVNIAIPASVRKQWKAAALKEDKTLITLIVEAMAAHIEKSNGKS